MDTVDWEAAEAERRRCGDWVGFERLDPHNVLWHSLHVVADRLALWVSASAAASKPSSAAMLYEAAVQCYLASRELQLAGMADWADELYEECGHYAECAAFLDPDQ